MSRSELAQYVRDQFGMDLYGFIKQKVEVDSLHDYEIASILNVNASSIGRLRRRFGIRRANGFQRRFERTYGEGAVETFKKMILDPERSLSDVGSHFGFSREYARHVYKNIFGHPYTEAYKKKRARRQEKRRRERMRKFRRVGALMRVEQKMKSMGLSYRVQSRGNSYAILTNGYRLAFRVSANPTLIGKRAYYRINNSSLANEEFDFFVCLCRKKSRDTHFIIPSSVMPKALISLLPEATPEQSKYAQFREAWHLLAH